MHHNLRRSRRHALFCTMCGREITFGQEYWACNGSRVCADCFPEFARLELYDCHETRGKEDSL